jgi:hypothetical protein
LDYAADETEFPWWGLLAFAGMATLTLHSLAFVIALRGGGPYEPELCCAGSVTSFVVTAVGAASLAATVGVLWAAGRRQATCGPGGFALAGFGYAPAAMGWLYAMPRLFALPLQSGVETATACLPLVVLGVLGGFVLARRAR